MSKDENNNNCTSSISSSSSKRNLALVAKQQQKSRRRAEKWYKHLLHMAINSKPNLLNRYLSDFYSFHYMYRYERDLLVRRGGGESTNNPNKLITYNLLKSLSKSNRKLKFQTFSQLLKLKMELNSNTTTTTANTTSSSKSAHNQLTEDSKTDS